MILATRSNLVVYVILFLIAVLFVLSLSNGTCDGCLARRLIDHGNIDYHQEGMQLCRELRADGHCQVNGTPDIKKVIEQALRDIYADLRGIPPSQ